MTEYTPGLWWHTWGSVWTDIAAVHRADLAYMNLVMGLRTKYGLRPKRQRKRGVK